LPVLSKIIYLLNHYFCVSFFCNNNSNSSQRLLGGMVGDSDGLSNMIERKVNSWSVTLKSLIEIAESQPQAAYAAFTHSIQHK
jgi:hypothetical protein